MGTDQLRRAGAIADIAEDSETEDAASRCSDARRVEKGSRKSDSSTNVESSSSQAGSDGGRGRRRGSGSSSDTASLHTDEQGRAVTADAHASRSGKDVGRKVDWSSDEDVGAAYAAFKARRSRRKRQKTGTDGSKKVGGKAGANAGSERRGRRMKKIGSGSGSSFSEDESEDEGVPLYLKQRRQTFEHKLELLGRAGLRLPPSRLQVDEFSKEKPNPNSSAGSNTKPNFPHAKPSAPYEDVVLKYSAGIVPAPIAQWLRDYQVQGAQFLHECFVYQKGGILGDDMGLGKTIQVIAFLTAAFGKRGDESDDKRMRKMRRADGNGTLSSRGDVRWYPRVMIICPGTLIHNWRAELARWGWWHVDVYHGPTEVKDSVLKIARSGWLEIMITTYTTYRLNKSEINTVDWDCVVADEFHCIKGSRSEISKALGEINALCRIGLTGTAIQNNYAEFFTLLNWTNPGRFGSAATWRTSISDPLKVGQAHDATVAQLARARKTATALVNNLLPRFFLRRSKALIADQLPKKSDRVVFCPLTETQTEAYQNFVDSEVVQYILLSSDRCGCGSGKKRGWCCFSVVPEFGRWQTHVFPVIVSLQKLSNHLALIIPSGIDTKEKHSKDLKILKLAFPERWSEMVCQMDKVVTYAKTEYSGKWTVLKKLLSYWYANGDKVLVFSHSVRLLKMLRMLFSANTSYVVSYLDGGMSYEDRAIAVDEFNSNPANFVFLISTKAGGVGLNITSANKVVIYDPNWNPAYDLQASDRAFRIGQTRDVEVFRLIANGTLDEIVYARQIYKQQQANIAYDASLERRYFRGIQDQPGKKGELFGLKNLFSFRGNDLVLKDIVNKTNIAESKAGVSIVGMDLDSNTSNVTKDQDGNDEKINKPKLMSNNDDVGDEKAAMSQLAATVASGSSENHNLISDDVLGLDKSKHHKPPFSTHKLAVEAIMNAAGVQYTHENSEVVGSSKIESRLSRRAMMQAGSGDVDGYERGQEYAFKDLSDGDDFAGDDLDGDLDGPRPTERPSGSLSNTNTPSTSHGPLRFTSADNVTNATDPKQHVSFGKDAQGRKYRYRPPRQVRLRQFRSMAQHYGYADTTDFAIMVESCSPAERKGLLDRFYDMRAKMVN